MVKQEGSSAGYLARSGREKDAPACRVFALHGEFLLARVISGSSPLGRAVAASNGVAPEKSSPPGMRLSVFGGQTCAGKVRFMKNPFQKSENVCNPIALSRCPAGKQAGFLNPGSELLRGLTGQQVMQHRIITGNRLPAPARPL